MRSSEYRITAKSTDKHHVTAQNVDETPTPQNFLHPSVIYTHNRTHKLRIHTTILHELRIKPMYSR